MPLPVPPPPPVSVSLPVVGGGAAGSQGHCVDSGPRMEENVHQEASARPRGGWCPSPGQLSPASRERGQRDAPCMLRARPVDTQS